MNIILASASPRRKELFSFITKDFLVIPANTDESIPNDTEIEKAPEVIALKKASVIAKSNNDSLVIGCDTGVLIEGKMLCKPYDEKDAFDMLKSLSGKAHKVITGCVLIMNGQILSFSETTKVSFYNLTDEEIYSYIKTKEPFDKAGAYGIQGFGSLLVKSVTGDFYNVVGLPVARLKREIDKFIKELTDTK